MKKVLILTYYFPPLGLGGTQRIAKFVKYLPQFGWLPTVVTVKPIAYWALDESLMKDVEQARIIRTESSDPQRILARLGRTTVRPGVSGGGGLISSINSKVLPFLLIPDSKILWQPFAMHAVRRLVRSEKFSAILTTSPPHSVHLIGLKIARTYHLPWLADFRDGWAGSHIVHEPTRWHSERNRRLQRRVINAADAVTCISQATRAALAEGRFEKKIRLIANGFDPADFGAIEKKVNGIRLGYVGTINRFADPLPFLDALTLLKEKDKGLYNKLQVDFVGLDTIGGVDEAVRQRGLERVILHGHQPHTAAVKYLQRADALLLIAKARPVDTFIPGKTFEYFGAQKPIFAISNSAPTNDLLARAGCAAVVPSFDSQQIYARLREFLSSEWHCKKINKEFIESFDRKKQSQQLAEILNQIT